MSSTLFFAQNLSKRIVRKLEAYEKGPFLNCSDLIASHCINNLSIHIPVESPQAARADLLQTVSPSMFWPLVPIWVGFSDKLG